MHEPEQIDNQDDDQNMNETEHVPMSSVVGSVTDALLGTTNLAPPAMSQDEAPSTDGAEDNGGAPKSDDPEDSTLGAEQNDRLTRQGEPYYDRGQAERDPLSQVESELRQG